MANHFIDLIALNGFAQNTNTTINYEKICIYRLPWVFGSHHN